MDPLSNWIVTAILVVIFLIGVQIYGKLELLARQRRTSFATLNGLSFLGTDLPPDLPPALTDAISPSIQVRNCFSGTRRGERVVAFEFAHGFGRQKRWCPAIGVQRRHPEQPALTSNAFRRSQADRWMLLYSFGWVSRLRSTDLLREWDRLHTTSPEEAVALLGANESGTNLHIKPKHELLG